MPSAAPPRSHRSGGGLEAFSGSSQRWAAAEKLAVPSPTVTARIPLSMSLTPRCLRRLAGCEQPALERHVSVDDSDALQPKQSTSLQAEMSVRRTHR